ncbi:MAG TPA: ABC transporter substrate-binding protein [Casimicrobiaceae bacterium]
MANKALVACAQAPSARRAFAATVPRRARTLPASCVALLALAAMPLAVHAAAPLETTDVTVYSSLDIQAPVQLITARKKGFFKQVGLNVTIKYLQSATDIVPGMVGGSIVLAHGGLANPILVADRGFSATVVSLVADYQRSSQLVVQKSVASLKPTDLAGKTMVGPDVPVLRMFWQNWASANKLDPKSVKWLSTAPSDAVVAFNAKQADILLAWAPHTTNAIKAGGVLWQDGHDSYRSGNAVADPVYYNWGVVFASTDWMRKNPNTLQAYLAALYMAQAYMKCHESEVAALVAAENHIDPAEGAALMKLNTYEMLMDPAFLGEAQKWSDFFEQFGLFKKHHAMRDVIDSGPLDRAVKSVTIPADWSTCKP